MGVRFGVARLVGSVSTAALKHVFRRPAANFPGKAGLVVDPQLIAHARTRIREGTVVVVGTNGKTTVTNVLADAIQASGKTVCCNRTGANLDSGVATALLHAKSADWGVFECDELWLAKVLPQLRPDFVVLLNLFRDQLDRAGEIDHVQGSIVAALASSSTTTLVYNVDDPLCQAIADAVGNERIGFGIGEDLELPQDTVCDAGVCQRCDSMLSYAWRQYGQLGAYRCPTCGFAREQPRYRALDVRLGEAGSSFAVACEDEGRGGRDGRLDDRFGGGRGPDGGRSGGRSGCSGRGGLDSRRECECGGRCNGGRVEMHLPGAYMVYNLLAACAAADCCGVPFACVDEAIRAFAPHNGRLQEYDIGGQRVVLNLAKNPTGFNQNLRIVLTQPGDVAVAFFINDKEADGHDVSWLWDVDFQKLSAADGLVAFAGGMRRNDMQVRLKYAGIEAPLVDGARDFLAKASAARADAGAGVTFFLIANYTALPGVKAELDQMAKAGVKAKEMRLDCPERQRHPRLRILAKQSTGNDPRAGRFAEILRLRLRMTDRKPVQARLPGEVHQNCHSCHSEAVGRRISPGRNAGEPSLSLVSRQPLVIVHLYPELLNLYGDGGNVVVLAERARRRGMNVEVVSVHHGQEADLSRADIVFLGGGPDREQRLASACLLEQSEQLRKYVEDDGVLLAICGGFQILGREWLLGDETVPGLGLIDVVTRRAEGGSHNRLVGNIALDSPLASAPVIGYENHAGRTFLGDGCEPFGRVIGKHGSGNNDTDGVDGVRYRSVVGTYLHGPVLAKNPEVADWLIARALERRAAKAGCTGVEVPELPLLDDTVERAANDYMRGRLA